MRKIIEFIFIFIIAQILIWLQTYGQYKWTWFSKNTWLLVICAMPISYLWIIGTRIGMDVFDNKSWSLRFIGFCTGIIVFAFLSRFILGEEMTIKTIISLILCFIIIIVQLI